MSAIPLNKTASNNHNESEMPEPVDSETQTAAETLGVLKEKLNEAWPVIALAGAVGLGVVLARSWTKPKTPLASKPAFPFLPVLLGAAMLGEQAAGHILHKHMVADTIKTSVLVITSALLVAFLASTGLSTVYWMMLAHGISSDVSILTVAGLCLLITAVVTFFAFRSFQRLHQAYSMSFLLKKMHPLTKYLGVLLHK